MPNEDGRALIRQLRAQAIQSGFQSHAAKPVEPAALLALVVRAVKRT